ncbi:tetratricopeptide repeat protein [Streptomyces sp. NPDC049837]|uniref:tetratricopeptide repeat protein n=1 Tax=Streptomyces sp. NPDC049837 TaxID=3155277 RepID=UPI00342D40E1
MRQSVRAESGFAYGVVGADVHVFGDGVPVYLLQRWAPAHTPDDGFLREVPSRMLNARFRVVEFTGRAAELASLRRWRDDGARLAVRWLHAPGGQGKTRLAERFAEEAAGDGWLVVTAAHGPGTVLPPPGSQDLRAGAGAGPEPGTLLIVDYADRWPLSHLSLLLGNTLLDRPDGRGARVLLLARGDDAWPGVRAALADRRAGTSSLFLPPLSDESPTLDGAAPVAPRAEMFAVARDSFAARYGVPPAGITPPAALTGADFGLTLAVHMAALVAVDARSSGRRAPTDLAGLTSYLLDREHLHWARLHGDGGHEVAPSGRAFVTPPDVMNRTVFTAALTGPVAPAAGRTALGGLGLRLPVERVLADHAVCYPPADPARETVLEPLYPDRLSEDFLALTLPGHQADYPPQSWAAHTVGTLLTGGAHGAAETPGIPPTPQAAKTPDVPPAPNVPEAPGVVPAPDNAPDAPGGTRATWTPRAVTFLAAAAQRWPHVGERHLFPLLEAAPRLAVAGGSTALTTLAALDDIPLELLEAIAAHFPSYQRPSTDLDAGIAAVSGRLLPHRLARAANPNDHAVQHHQHGIRLYHAGRLEEALAASETALTEFRAIDPRRIPDPATAREVEANLAVALKTHGTRLASLGRRAEALAVTEEAVTVLRRLSGDDERFLPTLAGALLTLGRDLSRADRWEEAAAAAEECVALHRRLAAADPGRHEPDLSAALVALGLCHGNTGRPEEAVTTVREGVAILRRLAAAQPSAYTPALANALSNLAAALARTGHHDGVPTAREAADLYRRLAAVNPAVHEPALADVLSGLALRLLQAGRPADGLPAAYEGVAILRRLAARQPEAHAHALAEALGALSTMLLVGRRLDEAVAVADECADVRRRMAEADPEIAPRFAFTLLNATGIRAEAGGARLDEAVALFSEATGVIERFGAVPRAIKGLRYAVGSRLAEQLAAEGRADAADRLRRSLGDPL